MRDRRRVVGMYRACFPGDLSGLDAGTSGLASGGRRARVMALLLLHVLGVLAAHCGTVVGVLGPIWSRLGRAQM